ncbi:unnamed protein product, partial [Bemisia tabaci]
MILPIVLNIASLTSDHGTTQFNSYLSSFKMIENMVRTGTNVQLLSVHGSCSTACESSVSVAAPTNNDHSAESYSTTSESSVSVAAPTNNDHSAESYSTTSESSISVAAPSDENVSAESFTKLKFKSKVISRGRPKLPARQLCSFNRTVADRQSVENPPEKRKRKKTLANETKGPTTRKKEAFL